jgi:hypothetical protein
MAKKIHERHIRKLTKVARSSIGLTLPIQVVRKLKWRARQKLVVWLRGKKLTIEDWKK